MRRSSPSRAYDLAVRHGSGWPLVRGRPVAGRRPRIGYYVWRFPSLTETFIQREVCALRHAGLEVDVFAEVVEAAERLDDVAGSLVESTQYVLPVDEPRLRSYRRRFLRRDPLTFFNVFAFTVLHRYAAHKQWREDVRVFQQALYLAGWTQDRGVTHLHSPWANYSAFVALLAARLAGVPYSVQARASADLYRDHSRWALAEKFAHAKFIVTNSEFNRRYIERTVPERRGVPIHVVYEGLDLPRFSPPRRQARADGPFRILSVGRLIEEKGFVHLQRALALLRERGCRFECVIVGGAAAELGDDYERELMSLRRELKLEEAVRFTGPLPFDQVLEWYAWADAFVLPCVVAKGGGRDVTPNALIEAMAMKLAVVATKMTGIPEIVEDRVSGVLVPPRNPQALAQAMERLASNPDLIETLGENARKRVEQRFDVEKNARRYLELFAPSVEADNSPRLTKEGFTTEGTEDTEASRRRAGDEFIARELG